MDMSKNSNRAIALLAGLCLACSVMYITSDGAEETILALSAKTGVGTSVDSTDVLKAGQIYSETPDGRMRLMDYFIKVEKEIATEVANRKADIASVRAQMARDFAFNAAARAKLKKNMLHKMGQYAKIAKDNLDAAMAKTQKHFARMAALENKRYKATTARDKATAAQVLADKKEAASNLRTAVSGWQRSTNDWAAATNAKINQMNKHVAANAAQIKENAKKAQKDLEGAMANWQSKINNFKATSKKGQSKLAAQFAAQDKAQRSWANNKITSLVATTNAQFARVHKAMAKQRHEIDMAMKHATTRFDAALNAEKALEDKRYSQTVANIAAAKAEATARVAAAKKQFKVAVFSLTSHIKQQVSKVNSRIDRTAGVVRSNKAAQAKVNANVNAELGRMVKMGNKRYKQHLKDDAELKRLIDKDKAETDSKLNKMAATFNQQLASVRKQLAKDRAHAEKALNKKTAGVWKALFKQQEMQRSANAKMAAATRRMKLDAMDAIRRTKKAFASKVNNLGRVVAKNDAKANAKLEKLVGVVKANERKSAAGRQMLAKMQAANMAELKTSLRAAIQKGEKRASGMLKAAKQMNKATRQQVSMNLATQISKLAKSTHKSLQALSDDSKEARAEMRKEMRYAIQSAASVAKQNLALTVRLAKKKFMTFAAASKASAKKSKLARQALAAKIKANAASARRLLRDSVAEVSRTQNALRAETGKAIKKSNTNVAAYANRMIKNVKATKAAIAAQVATITAKIQGERKRAAAAQGKANAADAARYQSAMKALHKGVLAARKYAANKFGATYTRMAKMRASADKKLAAATNGLNDALAKQAALADSRFSKTVKDLGAARKQAATQVAQLRKAFTTSIVGVTAHIKDVETRMTGEISVASGEVVSLKANQIRVNRRVAKELKRIVKISNENHSLSKRARGQLKLLMNENKAAASEEVKALSKSTVVRLAHIRHKQNRNAIAMARDLTKASTKLYLRMGQMQTEQIAKSKAIAGATTANAVATANALKRAKKLFGTKITMLTATVAANYKSNTDDITRLTGVVASTAKANKADRGLIKDQVRALEADMNKRIVRAIQIGEAKGKAVEERIAAHLKKTESVLLVELSNKCEAAADNVLKLLSGKRQKIADNYLSLKAYAVAAVDKVDDYVGKGKGKNLSSIGDLLKTVGDVGAVKAPKAVGLGMGGTFVPPIFGGKGAKVTSARSKINGLVNEYASNVAQVRMRWPLGLGKYLIDKLEISMTGKGVLEVDKVGGKAGNFVFINGRSVGLSNKLSDFSSLAVRMTTYEGTLAKLTAKLAGPKPKKAKFFAKAPEWQGN